MATRVWPTALLTSGATMYAVKTYENAGLGDLLRSLKILETAPAAGGAPSSGVSAQTARQLAWVNRASASAGCPPPPMSQPLGSLACDVPRSLLAASAARGAPAAAPERAASL